MSPTPVIGITLDWEATGGYSNWPWYALRQNYCDMITKAGGLPILLPHETESAEHYGKLIDGLVISGGDFDVDPALFGESTRHASVSTKEQRTSFEGACIREVLNHNKPVLGICGGQQLLNVVLGGTLIQHIPDFVVDSLPHEQLGPRDTPSHEVEIMKGTLLHQIVRNEKLKVNSAHHQAADMVGEGVIINAFAPDGVIEGIEDPREHFCVGVQWHPEYEISSGDALIFQSFIASCKN